MKPIQGQIPNIGGPLSTPTPGETIRGSREDFKKALNGARHPIQETPQHPGAAASPELGAWHHLKFSNHAIDRMQARGIRFSQEELGKIEGAVHKAAAKGAKETLLLTDSSALIVSVKDNTVVTVMDKNSLKENVFTNIDSTVVL